MILTCILATEFIKKLSVSFNDKQLYTQRIGNRQYIKSQVVAVFFFRRAHIFADTQPLSY